MANIEKFFAYRTDPGSGDKIGTVRYTDPITGDLILGEQYAAYGHPAKFIKVADDVSSGTTDLPDIGSVTFANTSTTGRVDFSTAFAFGASGTAVGLLVRVVDDASGTNNDHAVRKMIASAGTNSYTLNTTFTDAPVSSDTYQLWIDCFRYNAMLIKTEFTVANASCTIRPIFYSVPQDNVQPTPGVAAPHRYPTQELTIVGTDVSTDTSDVSATHYHGEIAAIGVHGACGAVLRVTSISSGTVSVWVALV